MTVARSCVTLTFINNLTSFGFITATPCLLSGIFSATSRDVTWNSDIKLEIVTLYCVSPQDIPWDRCQGPQDAASCHRRYPVATGRYPVAIGRCPDAFSGLSVLPQGPLFSQKMGFQDFASF